jgi:hypothetical protein
LENNYKTVFSTLKKATTVLQASNSVLINFENPADKTGAMQSKRESYGAVYFEKFGPKEEKTSEKIYATAKTAMRIREKDAVSSKTIAIINKGVKVEVIEV